MKSLWLQPGVMMCLIVLFLLTSFARAQTQAPSQNPSAGQTKQTDRQPIPSVDSPGSAVDTTTFKVGPEDILKIIVWREPDFSGLYTVHSDGKVTLPLVGDVQAGGLTAEEIQRNVTTSLSKLVVKPNVTVTVQQVLSQKYYMDGEVGRPGEYQLTAPITVLEAISIAGGLREFANQKKIYILRGDQRIRFNYKEVIKGKNLAQNIRLQSGDHVVVP